MKILNLLLAIFIFSNNLIAQTNCYFSNLSNDTIYQDYIEKVFDDPINDELIVLGTKISRTNSSNFLLRAPFFQKYNYCGDLIFEKVYSQIDSFIVWNHDRLQTNRTNIYEPIENRIFKEKNGFYFMILRVADTLRNKLSFILVGLDDSGKIARKSIIPLTEDEFNNYTINNIKLLSDNSILLVLKNILSFNYLFVHLNEDYLIISKKFCDINTEISEIEELTTQGFVCSVYGIDLKQYKVFCIDSLGNKLWEYNPYPSMKGVVRQIKIIENKILLIGYVYSIDPLQNGKGLITILNTNGDYINEISVSGLSGNLKFQSALLNNRGNYIVGGYVKTSFDSFGTDIYLCEVDNSSHVLWDTTYNFINKLGTSDNGFYNDYGGFDLIGTKDNFVVTFGVNVYKSVSPNNRSPHNDAILIKTNSDLISTIKEGDKLNNNIFSIYPIPVKVQLSLTGSLKDIDFCRILDYRGNIIKNNIKNFDKIMINELIPGLYLLQIIDKRYGLKTLKFIKT